MSVSAHRLRVVFLRLLTSKLTIFQNNLTFFKNFFMNPSDRNNRKKLMSVFFLLRMQGWFDVFHFYIAELYLL